MPVVARKHETCMLVSPSTKFQEKGTVRSKMEDNVFPSRSQADTDVG